MLDYQPISNQRGHDAPAMYSSLLQDGNALHTGSEFRNHHSESLAKMYNSSASSEYKRIGGCKQPHNKNDADKRDNYKPFVLRWPFLAASLVSLLALMGLLAYGLYLLPRKSLGNGLRDSQDGATERRGLLRDTARVLGERTFGSTTDLNDAADLNTSTQTATLGSEEFHSTTATFTETIITTSTAFSAIATSITETKTSGLYTTTIGTETSGPDHTTSMTTSEAFGVVETSIAQTSSSIRPSRFSGVADGFGVMGVSVTAIKTFGSITTTTGSSISSDALGVITASIIKSKTSVYSFTTAQDESSARPRSTESIATSFEEVATSAVYHGKVDSSMTFDVEPTVNITYETARVTIVTDNAGNPTYTSTKIPPAVSTPRTTTLTNAAGQPTATTVTSALAPPITTALTNSDGIATRTVVVYPVPTTLPVDVQVFYISSSQYFVGFCLPTLLSIIIAMPIRALNMNAKLFQPWHELAQPYGASGRESLNLPTSGLNSYANGLRALLSGRVLISLTTILMMCSVLLVPLSAETIVLQLRGNCVGGSAKGCTYQLSVSEIPAKAAIALLAFMCILVILIFTFLWKWKSGVYTNPWSICGMAGLTQNRDVRALFVQGIKSSISVGDGTEDTLKSTISDRRFKLDWFHNGSGKMEYGVVLWDLRSEVAPLYHDCQGAQDEEHLPSYANGKNRLPFMLGLTGTLLFISFLLGLIVYYSSTGGDTAFERFMDGQSFGTKFLFTSIGTIVTLFWSSFVGSVAIISPYQLLSRRPQVAKHSVLLSPPTNALSSISSGIRRRHLLLLGVGMTALLSEFLTIFLSNVPFRVTQTYLAWQICAYGSVSILSFMTLVVIASLFVKWPYMPTDPSTITGAMYYVCDSWMLRDFEHFSVMDKSECNHRANTIGQSYKFGEFVGQTGVARIGVDAVSDEVFV